MWSSLARLANSPKPAKASREDSLTSFSRTWDALFVRPPLSPLFESANPVIRFKTGRHRCPAEGASRTESDPAPLGADVDSLDFGAFGSLNPVNWPGPLLRIFVGEWRADDARQAYRGGAFEHSN